VILSLSDMPVGVIRTGCWRRWFNLPGGGLQRQAWDERIHGETQPDALIEAEADISLPAPNARQNGLVASGASFSAGNENAG
jgi:hypothetical protein